MNISEWRLLRAQYPSDPGLNYALERAVAESVGSGEVPPTLRLWEPGTCLALGRFDIRLPHFDAAVRAMKEQDVLIVHRMSGGKAVWQDVGYLNFSVIAPRTRLGIPEAYRAYSEGLIRGFRRFGVETDFEHVEGAFCDGPYDLAMNGLKLVGTAQVQKKSFMIVHGTILIDCDIRDMVKNVSAFYELGGDPSHLRAETMISLAHAAPEQQVTMDSAIAAFADGYRSTFGALVEDKLTEIELARARELVENVVL